MRKPAAEALSPSPEPFPAPPSRTKPEGDRRAAVLPEPEQGARRDAAVSEPFATPEPFAALLLRVAQGVSLRESCRALGMDEARFRAAVLADAGLAERFARARWCSADAQFDEIQELERRVLDGELEAATLRAVLDARKWRLARLRPAVYGDKSAAPSAGAGEGGTDPVAAAVVPLPDLSGLTPEQLLELTRLTFGVGQGEAAGEREEEGEREGEAGSDGRAQDGAPKDAAPVAAGHPANAASEDSHA